MRDAALQLSQIDMADPPAISEEQASQYLTNMVYALNEAHCGAKRANLGPVMCAPEMIEAINRAATAKQVRIHLADDSYVTLSAAPQGYALGTIADEIDRATVQPAQEQAS